MLYDIQTHKRVTSRFWICVSVGKEDYLSEIPVLFDKRPVIITAFAACLLGLLTSCANSPTGKALEKSLAADPNLKNNSTIFGGSSQRNPQTQTTVQLPEDFPGEIPLYPQAQLNKVDPLAAPATQGKLTRWSSSDPINAMMSFYQRAFASGKWQLVSKPESDAGGTFVARWNDLQVTVSIPSGVATANDTTPSSTQPTTPQTSSSSTNFDIQYIRNSATTASQPSSKQELASPTVQPTVAKQPDEPSPAQQQNSTDLDKVPEQLRQQIQDLEALGVLTINPSGAKSNQNSTSTQFEPNKTITRREFARWLVAANNQIYVNRPGQQIRLPSETSQPAFKDVPRSDPDFQNIQALAEVGLIPSPLTGDSTAMLFRPDAPLTRENLVLWKVPLDTRQALPTASIDSAKQTWGFQDVGKIDPKALRAVLADFQNGDQSNIRRVFGYTTLFQPKKPVTRGEAAAAIWYFGSQGEGLSAKEALQLKSNPTQATPKESPSNQ